MFRRLRRPQLEPLEVRLTPAADALRVVLISDAVAQAGPVARAAMPGVVALTYNHAADFADLTGLLAATSAAHGGAPIGQLGVVAHGRAGRVALGADAWDATSLRSDAATWGVLRSLLADDARIDLYACGVAAGKTGRAFVDAVAARTGALVVASDDAVGSGAAGDFTWEYQSGSGGAFGELFALSRLETVAGLKLEDAFEDNDSSVIVDGRPEGAANSPNLGLLSGTRNLTGLMLQDAADWYKFRIGGPASSTHTISLTHSAAAGNLDLYLYREGNTVNDIRNSFTSNDIEQINLAGLNSGTYYVLVFPRTATTQNNDYSLQIVAPPDIDDDAFEDNDNPVAVDGRPEGAANSPNLGLLTSSLSLTGFVMDDGADWYKFRTEGVATTAHTVTLTHTAGNGNLDLYLYREGNTVNDIRNSFTSNNVEQINLAGLNSGTYYLLVFPRTTITGNASYQLNITPPPHVDDDAFENNDSPVAVDGLPEGAANSPNLGTLTASRSITGLVLDDGADWYKFRTDGVATTAHTLTLTHTAGNGNLDLYLYREGNTVNDIRNSFTSNDVEQINLAGLPSGTYYFLVFPRTTITGNTSYQVNITPPPAAEDDAYEDNDSPVAVTANAEGAAFSPNLGVLRESFIETTLVLDDDADWYRFTLPAAPATGDLITLSHSAANGNLDLYLYTENNTTNPIRNSFTSNDVEQISLDGLAAGTYYTLVFPRNTITGNAAYSLEIESPTSGEGLSLSIAPTSIAETGATATGTVMRSGPTAGDLVVNLGSSDTTEATVPATVTIPTGQASATFTIQSADDALVDGTQVVTIQATAPGLRRGRATVSVTDNDTATAGASRVQFSAATYGVREGGGATATFTVTRTGDTSGAGSVAYATSNGTAAAADYTSASGTLNFAAGEVSKTFTVAITDDTSVEGDETVTLTLSNPSGPTLGSPATATLTIFDNDSGGTPGPGQVQFSSATYAIAEGGGTATITVSRTGDVSGAASVAYATADGSATSADYSQASGTLNFAANEVTKTFTVAITNDSAAEASETVALSLSTPTGATLGATASATLTILDDDAPPTAQAQFQFSQATQSAAEAVGTVVVTVTRTGSTTGTATVEFVIPDAAPAVQGVASPGADFRGTSGTLSFAPGEASKTFTLQILQDSLFEGNETVGLGLRNPSTGAALGAPSSLVLTIMDDDGTPNQRFVNQAYLDLLGRPADAAGLAYWSGGLDAGLFRRDFVAAGLAASLEYRSNLVQGLYQQYLGRAADPTGLVFFTDFLGAARGTADQVRAVLLGTDEYFARNGGTVNGFLQGLYRDLLNLTLDEGGRAYFAGILAAGGTRTSVASVLLGTTVADGVLVDTYYQRYLRRTADAAGRDYMVSLLQAGLREEVIVGFLVASDPYFAQAGQ